MGLAANNIGAPNWATMMDKLDRWLNTVFSVYALECWTKPERLTGLVRVDKAKWMHDISKARYSLNLEFNVKITEIPKKNFAEGIYKIWSIIVQNVPELNYDTMYAHGNEVRLDFSVVGVKNRRKKSNK